MLATLQDVLIACCAADDPVAALQEARLAHPELANWLDAVDSEGLRLTGLLVTKLRFERILRGDHELAARYEADAPGFVARFRAYCAAEPPTCVFPQEEAERFRRFLAADEA